MTAEEKTLTTSEYAKKIGVSPAAVARMLRQGKLRGEKRGGKWAIFESELPGTDAETKKTTHLSSAATKPPAKGKPSSDKSYDLETFSRMTYLTEKGIRQWLKIGRLTGSMDANGKAAIDAANLERPEIKHLIRNE
jgi:excisionase family DNA binding protein